MLRLLALCLGLLLILEGYILLSARDEIRGESDLVLILGCKIWGEEPSPALRARLDRALAFLEAEREQGSYPLIVVSGGKGSDEPISEARAMADYLAGQGIDPQRILLEEDSTSTDTNIANTLALLEERGIEWEHMTIVSNGFHLARVRMIAGRYGLDCSTLAAPMPTFSSWLWSVLREGPAFVKSLLLDG
ncbi:MAG: YdcF family protein [Oscillospiraceae bacterium]|nr:YdcF family protein [Oscillospiraceae bacterium]